VGSKLQQAVRLRSEVLRAVRQYFYREGLIEVSTRTLREFGASEPHLANLIVRDSGEEFFLQTSPEYAMKCLLAELGESIFQICPAFRGGEEGARHSVEFQMLEWYRLGFDLPELMRDLVRLLGSVNRSLETEEVAGRMSLFDFSATTFTRVSYGKLFEEAFNINPHCASIDALSEIAKRLGLSHLDETSDMEDYLDALFSTVIEPGLGTPTLVFDYPESQAALAEMGVSEEGHSVSKRFEFYVAGIEIANAYQELTDRNELIERFAKYNLKRKRRGLRRVPPDEKLLSAMYGMPKSAGIALGIDRLLMVLMGMDSIDQAIVSP